MTSTAIRDWVRVLMVGEPPSGNLDDYSPERSDRHARIVVDSVEGARHDPRAFEDFDAVTSDFDRLLKVESS